MSAVTLATAGISGATAAAEEPEGLDELRVLIETFAGEDVSEEALTQILSTYEAMGIDPSQLFGGADLEMLAALAGAEGEAVDPSAFIKLFMGAAGEDAEAFLKLEDMAFLKLEDMAFPKVEDQLFPKVEEPIVEGEAFPKVEDSIANVEAALADATALGDVDPATAAAILELLRED